MDRRRQIDREREYDGLEREKGGGAGRHGECDRDSARARKIENERERARASEQKRGAEIEGGEHHLPLRAREIHERHTVDGPQVFLECEQDIYSKLLQLNFVLNDPFA